MLRKTAILFLFLFSGCIVQAQSYQLTRHDLKQAVAVLESLSEEDILHFKKNIENKDLFLNESQISQAQDLLDEVINFGVNSSGKVIDFLLTPGGFIGGLITCCLFMSCMISTPVCLFLGHECYLRLRRNTRLEDGNEEHEVISSDSSS